LNKFKELQAKRMEQDKKRKEALEEKRRMEMEEAKKKMLAMKANKPKKVCIELIDDI